MITNNIVMNISTIISILIVIIICVILIMQKIKPKRKEEKSLKLKNKIDEIIKKYYKIIFLIILLLAIFLRTYKIETIPNGMHVDEVGMAYDAYTLQEYGVDRYLNKLPVYMINYGGGQSALYTYTTAILIKLLGNNLISIRLPAVIFSVLSIICIYKMVKKFKGHKSALLVMFLFTIMPWHIMQSRWGLDCNLLSSMITISIYLLSISKKPIQYIITRNSFWRNIIYICTFIYYCANSVIFKFIVYAIHKENKIFSDNYYGYTNFCISITFNVDDTRK